MVLTGRSEHTSICGDCIQCNTLMVDDSVLHGKPSETHARAQKWREVDERTEAVVAVVEEVAVEVEMNLAPLGSIEEGEGEAVTTEEEAKGIIIGGEDEAHLQQTLTG